VATRRNAVVVDQDGASGRICEFVVENPNTAKVIVELQGGSRVSFPADLLHPEDDGYTIPARWSQFAATAPDSADIPVIAESVTVGVRSVPREQLRVRRRVVTSQKLIATPVWREHIEVKRVPRDELMHRMPEPRQEGDTLIIPRVEEVAVVETRLRLCEELRIRVIREQHVDRRTISLRHHEIEIEIEREPEPDAPHQTTSPNPKKHEGETS